MKKIRLHVDSLEVLSFSTAPAPEGRGTVRAHSGYTCYVTVAVVNTHCQAYPVSYWHEESCTCPMVPYTDPSYCIQPAGPTIVDPTCFTCPGMPGC
jgi:hypothetical protein